MDSSKTTDLHQTNDGLARCLVISKHEHVAIDRRIGCELRCGDIVESRYDTYALTEYFFVRAQRPYPRAAIALA